MGFVFTGTFWSVVLILLGVGVLLNVILRTRIPFFRIFIALLLIYCGMTILFGPGCHVRPWQGFHESDKAFIAGQSNKHDLVFGSGDIDLTGPEVKDSVTREEVDVAFGQGRIKLRADVPVRVEVSSAFAEVRLPDHWHSGFGDYTYESKGLDKTKPYLLVKTDVAFGQLEVVLMNRAAQDSLTPGKEGNNQ